MNDETSESNNTDHERETTDHERETTDHGRETTDNERETRTWAMFLHFSLLAGFVVPIAGLVAPIIIWQVQKNNLPGIDEHGKVVVNWLISAIIYGVVSGLLTVILIGIPMLIVLVVVSIIFPIIGGIKANDGQLWKYPLSIQFFK